MIVNLAMKMYMEYEGLGPFLEELKELCHKHEVSVSEAITDYGEGFTWLFKKRVPEIDTKIQRNLIDLALRNRGDKDE